MNLLKCKYRFVNDKPLLFIFSHLSHNFLERKLHVKFIDTFVCTLFEKLAQCGECECSQLHKYCFTLIVLTTVNLPHYYHLTR